MQKSQTLPDLDLLKPILGLDAPVKFDLHTLASRETGLEALNVSFSAGEGAFNRNGVSNRFKSADVNAAYDPTSQTLNISKLALTSELFSAEGKAVLSNLGLPADGLFSKNTRFDVELDRAYWNGASLEIEPVSITRAKISGDVLRNENEIVFETLNADFGTFQPRLTGAFKRDEDGVPVAASLSGQIDGTLTHQQLLSLWPKNLILGGRRWVDRAINTAVLSNVNINFKGGKSVLSGEPLKNENLTVTFDISGGEVKYISTMTPITDVIGKGRLLGNQLEFSVEKGRVDDVFVKHGKVSIPRIYPKGGALNIDGEAQGPLKTLVGLLDQKPFEYVTPYGVRPDDFSGVGDISLSVTRPLLENITYDQVSYEVSGQLSDVTAPFSIGQNKLTNGNVFLLANRDGLSVKGPVNIGPWQTDLTWREVFDQGATPTRYQLNGRINQSDLDSFGLGLREFVGGGDVNLSIDAQADGVVI